MASGAGDGMGDRGYGKGDGENSDRSGMNPNRQKGFGSAASRIETPSLSDMQARQGAIVARFMTFAQRKSSFVVELYNTAFYKLKPNWDKIAEFICNDLCQSAADRKEIMDVQFHPVKMLIFVKCSDDRWRDIFVARLQSQNGIVWQAFGVRVKGYSLDSQVKFIRLLGASPETKE